MGHAPRAGVERSRASSKAVAAASLSPIRSYTWPRSRCAVWGRWDRPRCQEESLACLLVEPFPE